MTYTQFLVRVPDHIEGSPEYPEWKVRIAALIVDAIGEEVEFEMGEIRLEDETRH